MFPAERAMLTDSQEFLCPPTVRPRRGEGDVFVDELLVEATRALSGLAGGAEIVVDCSPACLQVERGAEPAVRRCVSLLVSSALASDSSPVELDVFATVHGGWEDPKLLLSVQALAARAESRWEPTSVGLPRSTRITRIGAQPGMGTLLVTQRDSFESRYSLGLDFRARVPRQWPVRVLEQHGATVLLADDNSRARRACRRLLEANGYLVREAARPLELLAQLDPDEAGGLIPAWLLVDSSWICGGEVARPGIGEVIEASMPADRVVLLGVEESASLGWLETWRALPRPFSGSELRSIIARPGPTYAGRCGDLRAVAR